MGDSMTWFGDANSIKDRETGSSADVTRYGQLMVGMRHDDILVRFEYNNSTHDVIATTTGAGGTSNSNALATVSSGTTAGTGKLVSKNVATYRAQHEIYAAFSSIYSTGQDANTYQQHGIFDSDNGFGFGYNGTSFGIFRIVGGVTTWISKSDWNKDNCNGLGRSGFDLDPTKYNQYRVTYGWLGSAPVSWFVYAGESRGWVLVHTYDVSNSGTTPSVLDPCLPITIIAGRSSGTASSVSVSTGSWGAGTTEGVHSHAGHRVFAGLATKTLVAGVETLIANFINNTTFQGKTNKVRIEASYAGFSCDGAKNTTFKFYRNSTITAPTWTSVNANNSVTSFDIVGTIVGGEFELAVPLGKADNAQLDLGAGHIHLELLPGETMSIVGLSAAASDVQIAFRWEEYFS